MGASAMATFAAGSKRYPGGFGRLGADLPRSTRWATRGLLVAVWMVALAATLRRRCRHGDAPRDRALRMLVLVVFGALFGAYLLILRVSSPTYNGLTVFPTSIGLVMGGIALLTTPILMVAATDFGEWGQLSGERLLALLPSRGVAKRAGPLLIPAAGCVALLVIAWLTQPGSVPRHLYRLGLGLGFTAVLLLIVIVGGRLLRLDKQQWPETLNFAEIFVVVAISFSVVGPIVAYTRPHQGRGTGRGFPAG